MKIVIIGAGGRLGAAFVREYRKKYDISGFNHAQLDLSNVAMTAAARLDSYSRIASCSGELSRRPERDRCDHRIGT